VHARRRPLRFQVILAVAALSLGACARSEQVCARRLRSFEAKLAALPTLPANDFGAPAAIAPRVTRACSVAHDVGPVLELAWPTARLDGEPLGSLGDPAVQRRLLERLETTHRHWALLHPNDHDGIEPLYVLTDAAAPASSVLALAADLPTFSEARLVVRRDAENPLAPVPQTATPQLHPEVRSVRGARDARQEAERLMALGARGRGTNAQVRALYERLAELPPGEQHDGLRAGIIRALEQAHCGGVDFDSLEASVLLTLTPAGPPSGWLPLRPALARRTPGGAALALPPDATVSDLASALEGLDLPCPP
jgi:hypothetical protein